MLVLFASIVLAVIVAPYAHTGFESIASAAEEMDEPDKTLPRAIPVAVIIVAGAYLLAIVAGMLLGSDPRWAHIRTSALTGKVLPVVGFAFALFLLVSFNFKSIFTHPHRGANVLAISLLVLAFVIVPLVVYITDACGRVRASRRR